MDWYLTADPAAASALRREVRGYLERHAAPGADIDGAELTFSELVTNAIENSGSATWVSLDWGSVNPVVTINDLGPGFELPALPPPPDSERGRGLMIASHLSLELTVAAKRAGGSRVSAVLDLERPRTTDYDFAPSLRSRLPSPEEAEDGRVPREPFLTALVVELADAIDQSQGPAVAEAAIAQVGSQVGSGIEDAKRAASGSTAPMTPEQIGEFYVDLKSAIGGDFYLISSDDERIVLGNRTCPFGQGVRHAPSLCRMTSSVFGGIAARNLGKEVAVHLEERIAVGDPECRVTVWLDPPPSEVEVFVHRYRPHT